MSLPRVYGAISAITSAFANRGIARERINLDDGYTYRGVDEGVERLAPLLAAPKLCILPRVLERAQGERIDPAGESLIHVSLRVAFDLVSVEDGSSHTIEAVGEALDHSDKASAKAMTSAYKHAVLHAFCIPVSGREDADRCSPGRNSTAALPAPVEGWAQWAQNIAAVVSSCATPEAIERLLASNRAQLSGLAREQPDEYARIGRAIAVRRKALAQPLGAVAATAAGAAGPAEARRVRQGRGRVRHGRRQEPHGLRRGSARPASQCPRPSSVALPGGPPRVRPHPLIPVMRLSQPGRSARRTWLSRLARNLRQRRRQHRECFDGPPVSHPAAARVSGLHPPSGVIQPSAV